MIRKLQLENNCEHVAIGICESCAQDAARDAEIEANGCSCGKPYVGVLVDTRTGREYFVCAGLTDFVIRVRSAHVIAGIAGIDAHLNKIDRDIAAFSRAVAEHADDELLGLLAPNTKSGPTAARPPVPTGDLLLEQQTQTTPGPEAPSTDRENA